MDLRKLSKIKDAISEIQIPTKQELIDHFRKLGEDLKTNPNWKKNYNGTEAERKSNLGEWETSFSIINYDAPGAHGYTIRVGLGQNRHDYNGREYFRIYGFGFPESDLLATSEQLEQNWESLFEESIDDVIVKLNKSIHEYNNPPKKSSKTPAWVKEFKKISKGMPYQVGEFDGDTITVFISGDCEGDLKKVKNEWMRKAIEADNSAEVINADRWNPSWDVAEEALGEVCDKLGLELEVDNVDPEGYTCYVSSGE